MVLLRFVQRKLVRIIPRGTSSRNSFRQTGELHPHRQRQTTSQLQGMGQILRQDKTLQVYVVINTTFTFFLAQTNSALPLYLKNFVGTQGLSHVEITAFFTLFVLVTAALQIPVVRLSRPLGLIGTLQLSAWFWGAGFAGIALTGLLQLPAWLGLSLLAVATAAYLPTASTWVAQLAPWELRGTYLAVNSLCWSAGYLLGPPVGGWFLDLPRPTADGLWIFLVLLALAVGVQLARLPETVP